jgi:hypothetical protein
VNAGIGLSYTTIAKPPSIVWSDLTLIDWGWADVKLRYGLRGHNGTFILQPVVKLAPVPWLSAILNGGRVLDHILDQYPLGEVLVFNKDYPISTSFQYLNTGQLSWRLSLHDRWRIL